MRWAKRLTYADARLTELWVLAQRPRYSQCPRFSSTGGLCSSRWGKILCFGTPSMENCRLLMRICSNASVTCDVPMVHSICLLRFHLYIYRVEPLKFMKLPMDSFSDTQSLSSLLWFLPPPVSIGWRRWRSYGGRLSEVSTAICR